MNQQWEQTADRVLGAALLSENACALVSEKVTDEMLPRPRQRLVLAAINRLLSRGDKADTATVVNEMGTDPDQWVLRLADSVTTLSTLRTQISQLRDLAHRGTVARAAAELAELASKDGDISVELEEIATRLIPGEEEQDAFTGQELLARHLDPDSTGHKLIPYPWSTLNRAQYGGGYRTGEIIVVGGYTGHGKTCVGIQMLDAAASQGHRVLFATFEMTADEIFGRLLLQHDADRGSEDPYSFDDETPAEIERLASLPYVVMEGRPLWGRVRAKYNRMKLDGEKPDVIIIDHLHLLEMPDRENYRIALNKIVNELKPWANREKVAVILLAQLNRRRGEVVIRDPENPGAKPLKYETETPKPGNTSLRESGAIEQIASVTLFPWRVPDRDDEVDTQAFLIQKKNRRKKPAGMVEAFFDGPRQRFTEVAKTN